MSFAKSDVYNPSVTVSPRRPFLASPSGGSWICDEGAKNDEGAGLRDVSEAAGVGQGAIWGKCVAGGKRAPVMTRFRVNEIFGPVRPEKTIT